MTSRHSIVPLVAVVLLATGCDNSAPGGTGSGPTTRLGKINQLGNDTAKALSEGGDNKDAVAMNATIKIEAAEARMPELVARAGSSESGQRAIKVVNDTIAAAKKALVLLDKSDPGAEPEARAAVRAALKNIDQALVSAREATGG